MPKVQDIVEQECSATKPFVGKPTVTSNSFETNEININKAVAQELHIANKNINVITEFTETAMERLDQIAVAEAGLASLMDQYQRMIKEDTAVTGQYAVSSYRMMQATHSSVVNIAEVLLNLDNKIEELTVIINTTKKNMIVQQDVLNSVITSCHFLQTRLNDVESISQRNFSTHKVLIYLFLTVQFFFHLLFFALLLFINLNSHR